ncbi:hypothetical protein EGW08_014793 [Elysia chlorotica]|uniref:Uncharacterized protein n=1 Tax=Elysia chlorotica TaxID=188477 RepID=A0A433T7B9_ELYCH|nr:hypothetical protein EGW08_014793 [Elysia chlorotica]
MDTVITNPPLSKVLVGWLLARMVAQFELLVLVFCVFANGVQAGEQGGLTPVFVLLKALASNGGQNDMVKPIIGGVPMSVEYHEDVICLKKLNIDLRSELKLENYRTETGGLTKFRTGRGFVYIGLPPVPLPQYTQIGLWRASMYYKGQKDGDMHARIEARWKKVTEEKERESEMAGAAEEEMGHGYGDTANADKTDTLHGIPGVSGL